MAERLESVIQEQLDKSVPRVVRDATRTPEQDEEDFFRGFADPHSSDPAADDAAYQRHVREARAVQAKQDKAEAAGRLQAHKRMERMGYPGLEPAEIEKLNAILAS
jgi:hypothetical protein